MPLGVLAPAFEGLSGVRWLPRACPVAALQSGQCPFVGQPVPSWWPGILFDRSLSWSGFFWLRACSWLGSGDHVWYQGLSPVGCTRALAASGDGGVAFLLRQSPLLLWVPRSVGCPGSHLGWGPPGSRATSWFPPGFQHVACLVGMGVTLKCPQDMGPPTPAGRGLAVSRRKCVCVGVSPSSHL